ncbi:methyltransferase [Duganella aceris]|uniref:Class I SAM-dependent methyltransferase n=1 Tax=Duganella aceris TaxID=2703883 RepID=A0ABX0FP20_9BURK|nr:class I SAM-dependent methyltransferase [Duganella aceris]NGZ86222.1 class I SAM-dependent methyltransferase [Duganella aceris]
MFPTPNTGRSQPALLRLGALLKSAGYAFVTISTPSHRRVNGRDGNETASDARGVFGWSRPFGDGVLDADTLTAMREAGIVDDHNGVHRSTLRASTLDGQLYFHSAFPTRDPDSVFFGPDTYRYVQVLHAELTEQTLLAPSRQVRRAVDIGCGAGPGAITIALKLPQTEVWAVDINPKALELTACNAALAGIGNLHIAHSDLLQGVDGWFDLIVANPPFMIGVGNRLYCDGGGVLGEGLSVAIVNAALERLAPGGRLVMYTCVAVVDGVDLFREHVETVLGAAGLTCDYREIDPDVFGGELSESGHERTDRIAAVALVASKPFERT